MSYEGKMLLKLNMPLRKDVEQALLLALFRHNGVLKEFGHSEEIVDELAYHFKLNQEQRTAYLETVYRKENRVKKSFLWHRLLYRAADNLAKERLISRPTQTYKLTNEREWMLTESGFDKALELLSIPPISKSSLPVKSFEVQKIVKKLNETPRPENYNPFNKDKKISTGTKTTTLRARGFRQAIIEAYRFQCAVCGLQIPTPDYSAWEVEAAHIVPHRAMGRDDIWNGLALCRLHHWAFDVGWFTLLENYEVQISSKAGSLPNDFGKFGGYGFFTPILSQSKIRLPSRVEIYPHKNAINWHRNNIFHQ